MTDIPRSGPTSLYEKVAGLGAPLRVQALVACAYCREEHDGLCVGDLVSESGACPVEWLDAEIERRKLEAGGDD